MPPLMGVKPTISTKKVFGHQGIKQGIKQR